MSTEKLNSPEKQDAFIRGFWTRIGQGDLKAKISLPLFASANSRKQDFLHELMHLYQDMHGFYFLPLQENSVFPDILDANSAIVAIMFNEAWAQTEVIRACWAIKEKGDDSGWNGAIMHRDFGYLAKGYDADLQAGMDERSAAATAFEKWYEGKHRKFYEEHALNIYDLDLARFEGSVSGMSKKEIGLHMRHLTWENLRQRIPQNKQFDYLDQIQHEKIFSISSSEVRTAIRTYEGEYGKCENTNIKDVKCGAPPYLWLRLNDHARQNSNHPPMDMEAFIKSQNAKGK